MTNRSLGALQGLGIGALAGAGVGIGVAAYHDDHGGFGGGGWTMLSAGLFGAVGAAIGLVVGTASGAQTLFVLD